VAPPAPVAAGITATLAAGLVGIAFSAFQTPLNALFGAGDTVASLAAAADRFSYTAATVGGLAAAAVAYLFLRRLAPGHRWPAYLLAGGFAGLVLTVTEIVTRVGGASLLAAVRDLSRFDGAMMSYVGGMRIRNALVIGFVGAIVTLLAVGRTLRTPE
jgi:hypothetical protein